MATIDEQIEKHKEAIKELNAKRAKQKAQEKKRERNYRTQALIEIGGIVLRELDADWAEFDADAFTRQMRHIAKKTYQDGTPIFDCKVDKRDMKAAHEHYQQVARAQRDEWKSERPETQNSDSDAGQE